MRGLEAGATRGVALSQDHGVLNPHARQELSRLLDKPISPLRQRMIDDMTARRFNEHTQRDYVRNVRMFAAFLGRSPDTATKEDLRRFQLHMAKQQMSAGSINAAIAALRFFFTVTLERPDLVLPSADREQAAPSAGQMLEPGGGGASLLEAARRPEVQKPRSASPTARACASPRSPNLEGIRH